MKNGKWRRAAVRFFLIAKHFSRLDWDTKQIFWETFWDISTASAADTTTHLPALAAAVRAESTELFRILARHPLPDVLVPEAVPWHDRLVAAREFHRASSAERTTRHTNRHWDDDYLFMLDWQPTRGTAWPVDEVKEVAQAWLETTQHSYWQCRRMARRQLMHWERAGSLTDCGIDLLPDLAKAVQTEEDCDVLWELAQWMPDAGRYGSLRSGSVDTLLRDAETGWQRHQQSDYWLERSAAWLAGIRLHQAGLAAEPPESFRKSYLSAVAGESDADVLFVLAQWSPDTEAPAAFHREWRQGWQQRLEDEKEAIRQVAAFALLRQLVKAGEMAEQLAPDGKGWDMAGRRRWLREFLRSYGQTAGDDEGNNRTVEFVNSLWTELNGGLFSRETTRGRVRAEASILGGQGAVFVHPQRDMVSPVEAAGSFTERKAAPVPGRSTSFAG